jgi:YidC/Oxa1 family membrane protein insertase
MKEKEHFLDKNTLIAVVLVFVGWFAWDAYMKKKYPPKKKPPVALQEKSQGEQKRESDRKPVGPEEVRGHRTPPPLLQKKPQLKEQVVSFQSRRLSFDISSKGMGFKKVVLSNILDRQNEAVWLFSEGDPLPFETRLDLQQPQSLYFDIERLSKYSWKGQAVWNDIKVEKTLSVNPDLFVVKAQVKVSGNLEGLSGIRTFLVQTFEEKAQKKSFFSFFIPPDFLSFFVFSPRGFEQIPLVSKEELQVQKVRSQQPFLSVKAAALGTKYFGQAWIEEKSDVLPKMELGFRAEDYLGLISHSILNHQKDFNVSYKMFLGPKDFLLLKKEYPELIRWVDFGWFGALSRFILQVLQAFYSLVKNWGVSIILLTLFVRLLLLPFVLSSHRSMEAMKKVQPELQKVREKFKKDPQRINQEVMAVMNRHHVNPLGGCLPLLLQIPVFYSLWKTLSNSYSLYRAPFVFWIEDLSWKDPYYVLPVLMGFFMFVQQKISLVTMNKEMARVMQIMPVFMTVFMINLPSGLVLYMLISTLFGLAQQLYLNKKGGFVSVSSALSGGRGSKK